MTRHAKDSHLLISKPILDVTYRKTVEIAKRGACIDTNGCHMIKKGGIYPLDIQRHHAHLSIVPLGGSGRFRPMYDVTVTGNISASHHLRGYQGKCENIHGHNYRVELTARAQDLDDTGLAIDFGILKGFLREVIEQFDHKDLNSCKEFAEINPSSENLARTIFAMMQEKLSSEFQADTLALHKVRVWETEGNFVTYRPDPAKN